MDNGSTASTVVPLSASRVYDSPMNYAAQCRRIRGSTSVRSRVAHVVPLPILPFPAIRFLFPPMDTRFACRSARITGREAKTLMNEYKSTYSTATRVASNCMSEEESTTVQYFRASH